MIFGLVFGGLLFGAIIVLSFAFGAGDLRGRRCSACGCPPTKDSPHYADCSKRGSS
jgi:hypothetical protein